MALSVDVIPNRSSPPAVLLRESRREGKRIRRTTLANLSKMPPVLVDAIRAVLAGGVTFPSMNAAVAIRRSCPHGHAAAVLGALRALGLIRILGRKADRMRSLAVAAVVARVLDPGSEGSTARALSPETASTSLGHLLKLGPVADDEIESMLDWLAKRRPWIERSLANRSLKGAKTLLLFDVTPNCLEAMQADAGYGIGRNTVDSGFAFALLCGGDGCPVAVEVVAGDAGDPATTETLARRARSRFGIDRIVSVGARGTVGAARIREEFQPANLEWISALTPGEVRRLLYPDGDDVPAPLTPESLVAGEIAEISSPSFPGERLLVSIDPGLRDVRACKREAWLQAAEAALESIARLARTGRIRGRDDILRRLAGEVDPGEAETLFEIAATDDGSTWRRREERIAAEERLDGIVAVRTSLDRDAMGAAAAVAAYRSLARVERAFRMPERFASDVRPLPDRPADRVRAQAFLCLLAYYVERHLRRRLAPLLFEDDDRMGAGADAERSVEGSPAPGLQALLANLSTLTLNEVALPGSAGHAVPMLSQPTPLQRRAFELLQVDPAGDVPAQ